MERTDTPERHADCREFRARIGDFLADEVGADGRGVLQRHLEGCPECARRLEVERGLDRALRARLGGVAAPPGLAARIQASLDTARPEVAWYRRPWVPVAAAAALLAVALLLPERLPSDGGGALRVAHRRVVLVDGDCDRAGRSYAEQRGCRHPQHVNELKLADGSYWSLAVGDPTGRSLLLDREMRGRTLSVDGDYYPAIRALRVRSFEISARRGPAGAAPRRATAA